MSRAIIECIERAIEKAKEIISTAAIPYQGFPTLKKVEIPLDAFDERNQNDWSPEIVALMKDDENRKQLYAYRQQGSDISIVSITIGEEIISSAILPCDLNEAYPV